MSSLFALLFLLFFGLLIWGLISPKSLSKFGKKSVTRKDAAIIFGLASFLFMILTGVTTPASISNTNVNNAPAEQIQEVKNETKPIVEIVKETEVIPFSKESVEDSSLSKGSTKISRNGADGERTISYEVQKVDGKEVSRKKLKEEVTKEAISEITNIGTKVSQAAPAPSPRASSPAPSNNCDPNYSGGCVPIVSYDLDCPDIGFRVYIIGTDKHGFDGRDNDGIGCESY